MTDQRRDIRIQETEDEIEIDLGRLLYGMWKLFLKLWWLAALLAVIGAAGFTLYQRLAKTPMYESSATFTVATGDENSGSYSFYYDQTTRTSFPKTFPYVLESSYFRSALLDRLGTESLNGTITAQTIEESNVVTMRVESPDPEDAATILSAALEIYPETARFVLGEIQFNMLDEMEVPKHPYNQMSVKKSPGRRSRRRAFAGVLHPGGVVASSQNGKRSGGNEAGDQPEMSGYDPAYPGKGQKESEQAQDFCAG